MAGGRVPNKHVAAACVSLSQMNLAVQLLPEPPFAKAPDVPAQAVVELRSKLRAFLDDVRRERPEPASDLEKTFLVRFSVFGLESIRLLGVSYAELMRSGVDSALRELVRKELEAAEVERKLALRQLEQATHTLAVVTEAMATQLEPLPEASVSDLFDEVVAAAARGDLPMEEHERVVVRFQMDVLVALDAMDAPLDELTYWAFRAVTGSRKVESMPTPILFHGLVGELARVRTRRAWRDWDQNDVAEELAPWPAPGSSR